MMKRVLAYAGVAFLLLCVGACKPKPGGSCKMEMKEVCADDKHGLACHDGKWEELACKGPDGCSKLSGEYVCDQSVAEEKETCNLADDHVCTNDKKGVLQCVKNHWTLSQNCAGERACSVDKRKINCDNSIANLGEACPEEDDYACSADKKMALVCKTGKFQQSTLCRGPKGCKIIGTKETSFKVECDDAVAVAGDACDREEHYACSTDQRVILKCRAKRFEVDTKCQPKETCQVRGQVGCF